MRRLLLLTALLTLLAPAAAGAATRHVVRGAGYGHGIGMSQYGAFGFAKQGRGYRDILGHYYRGTQISPADTQTIRVLLQGPRREVTFTGATSAGGGEALDPDLAYAARPTLRGVELRRAGGALVGRFDSPLSVTGAGATVRLRGRAINGVSDGTYRGALELHRTNFGGLYAVNAASLDDYVQGVVPGEVPATWPDEALKAQAVAARSYALATDRGGAVFDQYPDIRSQVYRGLSAERPRTNAAVRATAGEVVRFGGKVATTFFFSTSGGRTENIENVFYGSPPRPYLVSVEDPFDADSPKHRWRIGLSQAQMQSRLAGLVKGRFRRIKVVRRGASPRVVDAQVVGTRGVTTVRGATLRAKLGLFDTWAYFASVRTRTTGRARVSRMIDFLGPRAELTGSFSPAPKRGVAVLERRSRAGWRRVGQAATSPAGRYRIGVAAPGDYRLRAGEVAGPAVSVR